MASGALSLGDYPGDVILLACSKCERRGRYRKASLVAAHGPEIGLPDRNDRPCLVALTPLMPLEMTMIGPFMSGETAIRLGGLRGRSGAVAATRDY